MLLDMLLLRRDGRAVLQEIRNDPALRDIPVIALATSEYEIDRWREHGLPADGYLRKPIDARSFLASIRRIDRLALEVRRHG